MFTSSNLLFSLIAFAIFMISVILHEIAHGYMALRFGDPTAKWQGRLTLNPLPHIDPLGTILIPLVLSVLGSPVVFGWAKPVPVAWQNLRGGDKAFFWVSIAGILVNLSLAVLGSIAIRVLVLTSSLDISGWPIALLYVTVTYNLLLALFNLVPIPPLDGSRLLRTVLPREQQFWLDQIEPYGFVILFLFLYLFGPSLSQTVNQAFSLMTGL